MIEAESARMARLLDELLSLARLEGAPRKFQPLDVATILEEGAARARKLGDRSIVVNCPAGLWVSGDPDLLDQALLKNCIINLIGNAIKYSGENTFIEFNTEISKQQFTLTVKDNGIGIPDNDQKHLFEAFFRAHNTGNISGTGLGLNIVTRYTNLMHGQIKFKSQVNKGTSFTITFPQPS